MNKPDGIDQDAWDKAIDVTQGFDAPTSQCVEVCEIVSRAIMSAKAEEREYCATIADRLSEIDPEEDGIDPYEEWEIAQRVCAKSIANMIWNRSTES